MDTKDNEQLLTDRRVAEMLAVSVGFVRNGGLQLPFVKIGRAKRTRLSDVVKLIDARTITKKRIRRHDGDVEEIDLTTGARTPVQEER